MIRINLLPFRAARKKENVKRQITIYVLTVSLIFSTMGYFFWSLSRQLSALRDEEKNIQAELKKFDKAIREISEYEEKIAELKAKLDVIKGLEEKKTGPVHLLDEISMAVPSQQLWLRSFEERGGLLTLEGTAMDNETVARFMTNLEKSDYIQSVDLQSSRMRTLARYKLRVSDFVLRCKTYAFAEKPKPTAKARRGKRRKR